MEIFNPKPETHLSACRRNVFAIITIFIIILIIYSNTFHASWHFDDEPNITQNSSLHLTELAWQGIAKTFYSKQLEPEQLYRPAACLSFALNYYFGGDGVFGYHLVNIVIHFLAAVFLFLFIHHTLNLALLSARYGPNSYFIALLSTVLWAINPIQTQAITYIVQRMASMAGMFSIVSMYLYLKARTAIKNSSKAIFFSSTALCIILAFLSKENAIMMPACLFLFDFLLIQGVSEYSAKKNLKILLVVAAATVGMVVIFLAFSEMTFSSLFSLYSKRPFTLWERLLTQSRVLIFYISLILYPMSTRLSLNHDIAISHSLFNPPTTMLAIILIIVMLFGAIYFSRRYPLISFCVFFFFLNHMTESTVLPLELIYEHRNYIPSMLFFVPIAIGLLKAISFFSYKRSMQTIIAISIALIIIGEGHATFMRNFTWTNEESLWIDNVDKYPTLYRPQHNLARYYQDRNRIDKAMVEYEKALKLKATNTIDEKAITYFNLGVIYFRRKEFEKAKEYYLRAMQLDSCLPGVHNNLAVVLAATAKDFDSVHDELKEALICNPSSMRAHSNMGILLVNWGRIDEGIAEIKKALKIDPYNIPTLERLGYAYIKKGLLGTAFIYFKKILIQDHKNLRALLYLTQIYNVSGHEEKAKKSITCFVNITQDRDLIPFMDDLLEETTLLQTAPDMDIIQPLLGNAYLEKEKTLKKNIRFLFDR
jgi:tetratricopeptide (TPR) repeat protein